MDEVISKTNKQLEHINMKRVTRSSVGLVLERDPGVRLLRPI